MTPQEQVRQKHRTRRLPELAELIYQFDKGSPNAKLDDLRSDSAKGVYICAALALFDPTIANARMRQVHMEDAHAFASIEDENESIIRQAREDIAARYGNVQHGNFGTVRPGHCWFCKERITPADAFVLHITATLKADVHGHCAEKDARCEVLTAFAFRLIDGGRK